MSFILRRPTTPFQGSLVLDGSKSISNRALVVKALSPGPVDLTALSTSKDTVTLTALLAQHAMGRTDPFDAGAAGTTYRFMTALLATQPGEQILTGSERMKQRPIRILVDALRSLGAQITYLEAEGYPPLRIGPPHGLGETKALTIQGDTSSQYISALLLIAPSLPDGLKLTLTGTVVSRPYIEMTIRLMQHFGAQLCWEGETITVAPTPYTGGSLPVEADWSAASYYYSMLAGAPLGSHLTLRGLNSESLQGDSVLAEMMTSFGVDSTFIEGGVVVHKNRPVEDSDFVWDFIQCPDLAQTLAVTCAMVGRRGLFTGLETLRIKETDRILALQNELGKIGVRLQEASAPLDDRNWFSVEGKADLQEAPTFKTYEDHRMAMAFAPLASLGQLTIQEPMVVRKSYPHFYEDLEKLGFEVSR